MDERDVKIAEQAKRIAFLEAEIAELKRRLGMDSGNSSKPPSSDGLKKRPAPRSLRETTGKKSGGQVGHAGKTLAFRADADGIIDHHPAACVCGADLSSVAAEESYERRQVWDIPQPAIEVTEHRLHRKICAHCQTIIKAEVPENVPCGVSYGANIQAWAVYLQHGQLLPEDRLSESLSRN
jgi:transposase